MKQILLIIAVVFLISNFNPHAQDISVPYYGEPKRQDLPPENYQNLTYYLIPHSHTDAGWWLTFGIYYNARVRYILSSTARYFKDVLEQAAFERPDQDKRNVSSQDQRFIWADFAFFKRWWNSDATEDMQEVFRDLVKRGVVGLEHGGMVQHDEALSDYKNVIIMFDSGLQFIKDNFETPLPKVAFSLDGFGHSSVTPYLLKSLGFEALAISRVPYELNKEMQSTRQFLFTWEGDNEERMKVYRMPNYAIDDQFNVDLSIYSAIRSCFRQEDSCAQEFLWKHINDQVFNKYPHYFDKDPMAPDHQRIAFQTFGSDFSFQDSGLAFKNLRDLLSNLNRYLNSSMHFQFRTFSQFHEEFRDHFGFDKVYAGDMLVYNERNGDNWSGFYGSKPALKEQISKVFQLYRATESLMFIVRIELTKLSSVRQLGGKGRSLGQQGTYQRNLAHLQELVNAAQKDLDQVRDEISILLHHDAITGTCSSQAEMDWLELIAKNENIMRQQIQYELVERLGRLQALETSSRVEIKPLKALRWKRQGDEQVKVNGRGSFQVSVFNPSPSPRSAGHAATVSIRVLTENVRISRVQSSEKVQFTLVKHYDGELELIWTPRLRPFELATFQVLEGPKVDRQPSVEVEEETVLPLKKQYSIGMGSNEIIVDFDIETNLTTRFTFSNSGSQIVSLSDDIVYYKGDMTHSCAYIFNPMTDVPVPELSLTLQRVTQLTTHAFAQLKFHYYQNRSSTDNFDQRLTKIYTVYADQQLTFNINHFNISYVIKNIHSKEYFVEVKRHSGGSGGGVSAHRVFTENSAFAIERTFNTSLPIGMNTYPYVNGVIWSKEEDSEEIVIASNRPGGISLSNPKHDTLRFFLTRKLENVNLGKGLPDRLDDVFETRLDLVMAVTPTAGEGQSLLRRLANDPPLLVIETPQHYSLISSKSPFNLAQSGEFLSVDDIISDNFDFIDILHYSGTNYLRVRNQKSLALELKQVNSLSSELYLELVDDNLYLHCLDQKNPEQASRQSDSKDYILDHRRLSRYKQQYSDPLRQEGRPSRIKFAPFEMKCLRIELHSVNL